VRAALARAALVRAALARAARGAALATATITNKAAGMGPPLSHAEVLVVGREVAGQLAAVIRGVLKRLPA